ncbi:MAG: hypothetical protein AABY06_00535 [Nanoarchaeota archaeon]
MKNLFNKFTKNIILPLAVAGISYINVSAQNVSELKVKLDSLQTNAVEEYKQINNFEDCFLNQKDPTECSYTILENLNSSKKSFEEYVSILKTKNIPRKLTSLRTNTLISKEKILISNINKYLKNPSKENAKQCIKIYNDFTKFLNESVTQ